MFEKFTERARQVVVLAQEEESQTLGHSYIGTEHLLLGLLREEEGLAARVLESLGITVERVREAVVQIVASGEKVTSDQIPFTPRAKKVLEHALREALSLGHNYIGTEHLLLGLLHEDEGVAMRVLVEFGTDAEKIRTEVMRMLADPAARRTGQVLSRREAVATFEPGIWETWWRETGRNELATLLSREWDEQILREPPSEGRRWVYIDRIGVLLRRGCSTGDLKRELSLAAQQLGLSFDSDRQESIIQRISVWYVDQIAHP